MKKRKKTAPGPKSPAKPDAEPETAPPTSSFHLPEIPSGGLPDRSLTRNLGCG